MPRILLNRSLLSRSPLSRPLVLSLSPGLASLPSCRPYTAQKVMNTDSTHPKSTRQTTTTDTETGLSGPGSNTNREVFNDWVLSHPVYTKDEVQTVEITHLETKSFSDKFAYFLVQFSRKMFDIVTRYKHESPAAAREAIIKDGKQNATLQELRDGGYVMTLNQWLTRILFLETIAGVPGMVGGMLRHLQSLRLMKRDGGWIRTLLQEAENERMHLMSFMKIRNPGLFFRLIVLLAQGVYCNAFFFLYLFSPKSAHRFVGYLEEEACITYSYVVDEIKRGNIPEWGDGSDAALPPAIAMEYWRLPPDAKMIDFILAVRADEAGHRFVNHSLAALDHKNDFNPFAAHHPSATLQGTNPGFSRAESLKWLETSAIEMSKLNSTQTQVEEHHPSDYEKTETVQSKASL